MRRRQTCCMHGGYRGSGVTLDWHTTSPNITPIVKPTPSQPEPIDNIPIPPKPKPPSLISVTSKSNPNIAGIVGLTLGGVGILSAIGFAADAYKKSRSGIVEEGKPESIRGEPLRWTREEEEKEEEGENVVFDPENRNIMSW